MIDPKKYDANTQESDACDLDPTKTCDNCMKCIMDADFNAITISGIQLQDMDDNE